MFRRATPRRVGHAAALVCALATPAVGSPFEDSTVGGAVFTGPVHGDMTSIVVNPAALGLAPEGVHFYLGGSLHVDQIGIDRRGVDPATGAETPGASVDAITVTPTGSIGVMGSNHKIGIALVLSWPPVENRFVADQEALRYHSLGGSHDSQHWGVLGTWLRVDDPIVIGVAVGVSESEVELRFDRDTALEAGRNSVDGIASDCGGAPCGLENPAAAEHYVIHTDSSDLGDKAWIGLGVTWELPAGWLLGASYRSPPGFTTSLALSPIDVRGTVEMTAAPRDQGSAGAVVHRGDAEISFNLPQTLRVGVRGPVLPGLDLVAAIRYETLSRHGQYDIRMFGGDLPASVPSWYPRYRGFDDVVTLEAGLEQHDGGEPVRLGGRLRFESGAVDAAETTPLQVEGLNLAAAVGIQLRLGGRWMLRASYGLTWYPQVSASPGVFDPIGRLDCVDADYDYDQCAAVREGRGIPTAAGDYRRLDHALRTGLYLEY